jgi:hypothetical protein
MLTPDEVRTRVPVNSTLNEYLTLGEGLQRGGSRSEGPLATSYYKSISPFDTDKYPVERIDVVLPKEKELTLKEYAN